MVRTSILCVMLYCLVAVTSGICADDSFKNVMSGEEMEDFLESVEFSTKNLTRVLNNIKPLGDKFGYRQGKAFYDTYNSLEGNLTEDFPKVSAALRNPKPEVRYHLRTNYYLLMLINGTLRYSDMLSDFLQSFEGKSEMKRTEAATQLIEATIEFIEFRGRFEKHFIDLLNAKEWAISGLMSSLEECKEQKTPPTK